MYSLPLKRNYADKGGWLWNLNYMSIASLSLSVFNIFCFTEMFLENVLFDSNASEYRLNDVRDLLEVQTLSFCKRNLKLDVTPTYLERVRISKPRELRKCIFSEADYVSHSMPSNMI